MVCFSGARYSMKVDILVQGDYNIVTNPANFVDTFNRANSTSIGNGWTELGSNLSIVDGEVVISVNGTGSYVFAGPAAVRIGSDTIQKISFEYALENEVIALVDANKAGTYAVGVILTGTNIEITNSLGTTTNYPMSVPPTGTLLVELDRVTKLLNVSINSTVVINDHAVATVKNNDYVGFSLNGIPGEDEVNTFTLYPTDNFQNNAGQGSYFVTQDPDTGQIVRKWVAPDKAGAPEDVAVLYKDVKCSVRGVVDGGIRVAGTTERFDDLYSNIDWAKMTSGINVSKRHRITNIRASDGALVYSEEDGTPTTFEVLGSTPVLDPFDKIIEYITLLQRGEVQ